jgi:hypothetical protein
VLELISLSSLSTILLDVFLRATMPFQVLASCQCYGHSVKIDPHQLIGVEPCQLAQLLACAVEEAALRAFG